MVSNDLINNEDRVRFPRIEELARTDVPPDPDSCRGPYRKCDSHRLFEFFSTVAFSFRRRHAWSALRERFQNTCCNCRNQRRLKRAAKGQFLDGVLIADFSTVAEKGKRLFQKLTDVHLVARGSRTRVAQKVADDSIQPIRFGRMIP